MRKEPNTKIERYRMRDYLPSAECSGTNCGAFEVPFRLGQWCGSSYNNSVLRVISSDQDGWDHVSVSLEHRTPTREEMCFIKDLFFCDDEVVMQLHPAKENYINNHPYVLHLWRPHSCAIAMEGTRWPIPLPPKEMV